MSSITPGESYIQELKNLKQKLQNQKMSVLVGAGFSKNVHKDAFPSWWELLYDVAYFLIGKEIENEYLQLKHRIHDKEAFLKDRISTYIEKVGYLELISQYVKQKGFREAIETYIEERTPKVVDRDGKAHIQSKILGRQFDVALTPEALIQHKRLLRLPWNNIYTTNYDEMLEYANEEHVQESIVAELRELKAKIRKTEKEKIQKTAELENATEDAGQRTLRYELQYIDQRLHEMEKDVVRFDKNLTACISTVKRSEHLSLKRNKNIIKLHGSIRQHGDAFGFDGDNRKHYVIAREDYETYPEKHEAFTQLMRISLLQESYCLLGFSGVDPNFVQWIKWVRDVLEREREKKDREYKIYLVEIGDAAVTDEQKLFYENHGIFRIPLGNKMVTKFLLQQKDDMISGKAPSHPKEYVNLFLNYLADGKSFSVPQATFEKIQQNKYTQIWRELKFDVVKNANIKEMVQLPGKIAPLKRFNRFPEIDFSYSFGKRQILGAWQYLIEGKDAETINALTSLVLATSQDVFLPASFISGNEKLGALVSEPDISEENKAQIDKMFLRLAVLERDDKAFNKRLRSPHLSEYDKMYETILHALFSFDIRNALAVLEKWNPKPEDRLKKIGLLVLFDPIKGKKELEETLHQVESLDIQEQLHSWNMKRYVDQRFGTVESDRISGVIGELEDIGFIPVVKHLEKLCKTDSKKQKIERYGKGRLSFSRSFKASNELSQQGKGVQFLQLLLESGFPLKLKDRYIISPEDWYFVFKGVYEYLPFPSLFFMLQYSNDELLRRGAQDYVNSPHLKEEVQIILPRLFKTYLDNPDQYALRRSILWFCCELFVAVDATIWQKQYAKIIDDDFKRFAFDDRRGVQYEFFRAGLRYLKDLSVVRKVIIECLDNFNKEPAIKFLNLLQENSQFKNNVGLQTKGIKTKINRLIANMDASVEPAYIVINLLDIMTPEQKAKVFAKVVTFDFAKAGEYFPWAGYALMGESSARFKLKIKNAIIANTYLWNAGFTAEGVSSRAYFVPLKSLRYKDDRTYGLKFTEKEIVKLYRKMQPQLMKIVERKQRLPNEDFLDFGDVLDEMAVFLETYSGSLKKFPDYDETVSKIEELVKKARGFDTFFEGLISIEHDVVLNTLERISPMVFTGTSFPNQERIATTLLNKILLQAEPALETCIAYLTAWITTEDVLPLFESQVELLLEILKQYKRQQYPDADIPFLTKSMSDIAVVLTTWGFNDMAIEYWKEIKIKHLFYN